MSADIRVGDLVAFLYGGLRAVAVLVDVTPDGSRCTLHHMNGIVQLDIDPDCLRDAGESSLIELRVLPSSATMKT